MKLPIFLAALACTASLWSTLSTAQAQAPTQATNPLPPITPNDWRNYYGVCWRGTPANHLKFARQMGYGCIVESSYMVEKYRDDPSAQDMLFYLSEPEYVLMVPSRGLEPAKKYTPEQQAQYEQYYAWKSLEPFPNNIATGWFFNANSFSVQYDFQQQKVIDYVVDGIIKIARRGENKEKNFRFGGIWWDVADFTGDFWDKWDQDHGRQRTLAFWTGKDSSMLHPGITHEYETYSEGKVAFYKQLFSRVRKEWPDAKFIMEPYKPYNDWMKNIENRPDRKELMPDMLAEEGTGTEFVDDEMIFKSGLITKENMASSQPNHEGDYENRLIAGKAAINGAWYAWSGRFGGTGNMPNYNEVMEVPPRLQLIHMLPAWDNLAHVPLTTRSWDGDTYSSPNSLASQDIIYSRHPFTKKLFVVWLDSRGKVTLKPGEKVLSVRHADGWFCEGDDGKGDLKIENNEISLRNITKTKIGYIITLGAA